MSEIRFACPYCSQHIACDSDYGDLSIECPSCDGAMVVPRLSAVDSALTGMVIVASTPLPNPRVPRQIPTLESRGERYWAEHFHEATSQLSVSNSLSLASVLGVLATLVVPVVLMARGLGLWLAFGSYLLCGLLTGLLTTRGKGLSGAESGLAALKLMVFLVVVPPIGVVGILAILMAGCSVCGFSTAL